jgi:pyruvate dehydrogenase E2 component (dihydrolipoamide acetyltransferase)
MPSLGADMDEGTLLEWRVGPGDVIHPGDIVAVVDTSKSAVEIESFEDGVVADLLVEPGTTVPVGTPLAALAGAGAPAAIAPAATPTATPSATPTVTPAVVPAVPAAAAPAAVPAPSPVARHRAAELGLDLADIPGTGAHGAVTRKDVERAGAARTGRTEAPSRPTPAGPPAPRTGPGAEPPGHARVTPYARRLAAELGVDLDVLRPSDGAGTIRAADVRAAAAASVAAAPRAPAYPTAPPAPAAVGAAAAAPTPQAVPEGRRDRTADMRQAIARLMSRSNREIPHYYLSTTVDLGAALEWLRARNKEVDIAQRLVPAALLLRAVTVAVGRHPALNGHWLDDAFRPSDRVHLGVAVSLRGGGLIAPALRDAQDLSLPELMGRLKDLVARARSGTLRGSELTDPTITVTNLGEQGVESVHGVIYPPQVALVGAGRVTDQVRAVGGLLGVRPCLTLTLAADHRATDGYTGGRFLTEVDRLLQTPEAL